MPDPMTPPLDDRPFIAWCRENRLDGENYLDGASVVRLFDLSGVSSWSTKPDETRRICDIATLRLDLAEARAQAEQLRIVVTDACHALGIDPAEVDSSGASEFAVLISAGVEARAQVAELQAAAQTIAHLRAVRDRVRHGEAAGGNLSDAEVAGQIRMLMRDDLEHEMVCVMGRDRIIFLSDALAERDATILRLAVALQGTVATVPPQAESEVVAGLREEVERLKLDSARLQSKVISYSEDARHSEQANAILSTQLTACQQKLMDRRVPSSR